MYKKYGLDKYKNEIIDLYVNKNYSCDKISKYFGCSLCGIYDALKRWGVNTRNLSDSHKKYSLNENYFKNIDSEDKAYWLGFIYADGYITGNSLGIALSSKDIKHLEKFSVSIESDYPINNYYSKSEYGSSNYSRILLNSKQLTNDIKNKGVVNHKSLILSFPDEDILSNEYYRHFIRGYFDGDGSLILSNNSINFKFCGTKELLERLIYIFNDVSNYTFKKSLYKRHNDEKNNCYISYGGRLKTLNIMDYLYKDCSIYLDRKYEKYLKLKSTF